MTTALDGPLFGVIVALGVLREVAIVVAAGVLVDWYFRRIRGGRASGIPWRRWLTVGPAVAVLAYFLWSVRAILAPFLVAFFLAALLDPVVVRIERGGAGFRSLVPPFLVRRLPEGVQWRLLAEPRGISRARAVGGIFGALLVVIVLIGVLVIPPAMRQIGEFASSVGTDINKLTSQAQGVTGSADAWYKSKKSSLSAIGIKDPPSKILSDKSGPIAGAAAAVLGSVKDSILAMMGQVLWLIIVPLSLLYFLMEFPVIRAKLISFVPNAQRAEVNRMSTEIVEIFGTYILGLAKVCALYGLTCIVFLLVFQVRYSVFLGMASGVLYAVPYIGPILAIGSAGLLAFVGSGSVGHAVLVMLAMTVLQFAFDYVVTPRVVGGSVGLHPLVNIFALMTGATLFGLWGMLLAVPVAASIQKLLIYFVPALGEAPARDRRAAALPPPSE